jgi:hypothetical protein
MRQSAIRRCGTGNNKALVCRGVGALCKSQLKTKQAGRLRCDGSFADVVAGMVIEADFSEGEIASPGLMLGWSGIGMFLLRSQDPSLGSPLYPRPNPVSRC